MKLFSILQSMKQYLAGLLLRSISDDLETAAALSRADRVRELESQAVRDRDDGLTQTAALLETSASRLLGSDQADEGFAFVDSITKRAETSLVLNHHSLNGDVVDSAPEPTKKRPGRRRKNDSESNSGDGGSDNG